MLGFVSTAEREREQGSDCWWRSAAMPVRGGKSVMWISVRAAQFDEDRSRSTGIEFLFKGIQNEFAKGSQSRFS